MSRIVADVGNTRIKLACLANDSSLTDRRAADIAHGRWKALVRWLLSKRPSSPWSISSVNPRAAAQLESILARAGTDNVVWFRSAHDVPMQSTLRQPCSTGADRALAVLAATHRACARNLEQMGLVASCGTAITVERIDENGLWTGGAIAPGLRPIARALRTTTAQLPEISRPFPRPTPAPYAGETQSAIEAGIHACVIGTARELIARQSATLNPSRWLLWTGGDAEWVAPEVSGAHAWIVPDLVLEGLALAGGNE